MKRALLLCILLATFLAVIARAPATPPAAAPLPPARASETKLAFVDIYLDSRQAKLAAYQFEFSAEIGHVELVGIEGGEHPAFTRTPPYYDPAALNQHRVIIAAFSLADDLPIGKTRIARLHLAISGDTRPQYAVKLEAAASPDGKSIIDNATISVSEGVER